MLSENEIRVLNELVDDMENIESISRMLQNGSHFQINTRCIVDAIVRLFDLGFIDILEEVSIEGGCSLEIVQKYDIKNIHRYWFRITNSGKVENSRDCYDNLFN
jgi:hypothetical protein